LVLLTVAPQSLCSQPQTKSSASNVGEFMN
jgi:hypothetical protein